MALIPKQITQASSGAWVGNEYSSVDPFSLNCKHLLLVHHDHFELYSGEGQWLSRLSPVLSASSEPRWSRTNPYLIYYLSGNELREFDVRTDNSELVRRFAGSQTVKGRGESDISEDGDHLVLSDEKGQVWLYNLRTDQVSDGYAYTQPFNSLYVTPDNNVLVGTADKGVSILTNARQIAPTISHMDVGRDQDGREVLIRTNSADTQPLPNCPNGIEKVDIRTGERRCLTPMEWTYAVHISCPAKADWCIVSTYSPTNAKPSQILRVNYSCGAQVLCDTGSVMIKTDDGIAYNPQPKAAVSWDGSRLVFSSNNGDISRGPIYCDTFLMKLQPAPAPIPPKEPPIVISPSPDLRAELVALRRQLAEHEAACDVQIQERDRIITALQADKAAAVSKAQDLESKLAAIVVPHVDPELWKKIDFLRLGHAVGQRWGFEVNQNGRLTMSDVDGEEWTSIYIPRGNQYLFVATDEGLEEYERRTNKGAS